LYFNEIGTVEISTIKWDALIFNRNNTHYDTLLYFCRLICEEAIANKEKGKKNFRIIEDRLLPKLFERFIYAFYKKELQDCRVLPQKKIEWKTDNYDMLPDMSADTIIIYGNHKLIIDTKYYSKTSQIHPFSNNRTIISSNLYQIFAYVKNESANSPGNAISGMLLYPRVDDEMKSKPYNMDGNNVFVRTVDLNRDFQSIRQELMEIYACAAYLKGAQREKNEKRRNHHPFKCG
jgi:5-methylcytosine-specific restriction enzyme subunit McrC